MAGKIERKDHIDVTKIVGDLTKMEVYVGIPEANTSRPGEPVTNAELLYIHSKGSALKHIPARPVIEPAIEAKDNKEAIADALGKAANSALDGDAASTKRQLHLAGQTAENASRAWFTDPRNGWAPNAPSTIKRKGSDRPLINTGELRKKITHVVKD